MEDGCINLINDKLVVFRPIFSDIWYIGLIVIKEGNFCKYLVIIMQDLVQDT